MSFTIQSAQSIFPGTLVADIVPTVIESFSKLNAEDQLALLWFAYTEMTRSITVAAPGAANMILAQGLMEQIKLSHDNLNETRTYAHSTNQRHGSTTSLREAAPTATLNDYHRHRFTEAESSSPPPQFSDLRNRDFYYY